MVNSCCRGFFAVKTGRLSSQNNLPQSLVMSVVFSTFKSFHNKIVMFFLPFGLASGREIRSTAAYSASVRGGKKQLSFFNLF
jgi:hypothetical protein